MINPPVEPNAILRQALRDPQSLHPACVPVLLAAGLAGWVYAQLPEKHLLRPLLEHQCDDLNRRHARAKEELLPLLRAWNEAGIAFLLLKGFAHAELTYPEPAQRYYGDVDVLIHVRDLDKALRIAGEFHFQSDGVEASSRQKTKSHEVAHLFYLPHPGASTGVRIDVHQDIAVLYPSVKRRVKRATRAFWAGSQAASLDGVAVRVPAPRDQILMLALTRVWCGEQDRLKPTDMLDYQILREKHGVSSKELGARAVQLGISHTWRAFERVLVGQALGDPIAAKRVRRAAWLDGHAMLFYSVPARVLGLMLESRQVLRALPHALGLKRDLKRGMGLAALAAQAQVQASTQPRLLAVKNALRIAHWTTKLLDPRRQDSNFGLLVTYYLLAAYGVSASFVIGERRLESGTVTHAWIEYPDILENDYGDRSASLYRETFRHSGATGARVPNL